MNILCYMLILQLHYFNQQWKYLMLINLDNLILGNECEKQGSHSSRGAGQL